MFNFTVYRGLLGIMSGFCSMQNPYLLPKMFNFSSDKTDTKLVHIFCS